MTISKMITILNNLLGKHGDVEVYFDCPKCNISFNPDTAAVSAVHIKEKLK